MAWRAGLAVLVYQAVATTVAALANYPAQFDGVGEDAAGELFSRGTALSAPVPILLALAAAVFFARRGGRLGVSAVVLIAAIGVVFTIGSLGEAFAEPTPDVSKAVLVAGGAVGAAISVGLVAVAVADLWRRRSSQ